MNLGILKFCRPLLSYFFNNLPNILFKSLSFKIFGSTFQTIAFILVSSFDCSNAIYWYMDLKLAETFQNSFINIV